jgi:hypothetical protein
MGFRSGEIQKLCAGGLDRFTHTGNFEAGEVVDDDCIASREDLHHVDGGATLGSRAAALPGSDHDINPASSEI